MKNFSSIKSQAKRYGTKAASWTMMVLATVITVLLIGHYLLPRTIEWVAPPLSENSSVGDAQGQYGIQEIINAVRTELIATQDALVAKEDEALFQVETFDIELSFVVTRGVTANANVKVPQFLVVGTDTEYKKEQVQKIRLHLSVDKPAPFKAQIVDEVQGMEEAVELR